MNSIKCIACLLLILLTGCLTHYDAPTVQREKNILVVDAFINLSDKAATVKLSRTIELSSTSESPQETGAMVTILSDHNDTFRLSSQKNGSYSISNANFDLAKKYQLKISTKDGNNYSSDLVALSKSPEIDSITWSYSTEGVTIAGTTHDPEGFSKYYMWDFNETWKYTSPYQSGLLYRNNEIVFRKEEDDIYVCYRTLPSSTILIASTSALSSDVLSKFPIRFRPKGSELIQHKYSIEAKVRSIHQEEYNYWSQVKKTTESFGGLFDPLPSQVVGNIHNDLNAGGSVIGYFAGGTIAKTRVFIDESKLPDNLKVSLGKGNCEVDSIKVANISGFVNNYLIINSYGGRTIIGYLFTTTNCADCRKAGGSTTKPDFWQ
jgi:hypothetical protein